MSVASQTSGRGTFGIRPDPANWKAARAEGRTAESVLDERLKARKGGSQAPEVPALRLAARRSHLREQLGKKTVEDTNVTGVQASEGVGSRGSPAGEQEVLRREHPRSGVNGRRKGLLVRRGGLLQPNQRTGGSEQTRQDS